ncbi:MAG: N-acetylmuramoyl-L-alanine amidase, partial [Lentilitoribacter sp.]
MHYTAGYSAASAVNTFKKKSAKASAHFVVEVDGSITQMVSTEQCAWHSGYGRYQGRGRVNDFSIGIEIVNPGYHFRDDDGTYLNWQKKAISKSKLAPFPGMLKVRDPWVGSRDAFWPEFPVEQLKSLEQLLKALLKSYPSLRDVVGHRDVDTVRKIKVDPGPAFPMRQFRLLLDNRDDDEGKPVPFKVSISSGGLNVRGGPGTSFERMDWGPLYDGEFVER